MHAYMGSNLEAGTARRLGVPTGSTWVGNSAPVVAMQQKIKRLATTNLPVLISGEEGTGKTVAAHDLHCQQGGGNRPFIVVACDRWDARDVINTMEELWQKAQGGTLFLQNIDGLPASNVHCIKSYWYRLSSSERADSEPGVRLISSVRSLAPSAFNAYQAENDFIEWLYYHCLTIRLNTLQERWEDIVPLIESYGAANRAVASLSITECGLDLIRRYGWPGNVKQLKRFMEKLSVLEPCGTISSNVILKHFPVMVYRPEAEHPVGCEGGDHSHNQAISFEGGHQAPDTLTPGSLPSTHHDGASSMRPVSAYTTQTSALMDASVPGELIRTHSVLPQKDAPRQVESIEYHPALDKSLRYLRENYRESFSMPDLAAQACCSPSHLSSLFKRHLNQSFKQVQLKMRIDESVRLLKAYPNRQITHICDDVGFSDLSFFVKRFKKTVGVTPSELRKQFSLQRGL